MEPQVPLLGKFLRRQRPGGDVTWMLCGIYVPDVIYVDFIEDIGYSIRYKSFNGSCSKFMSPYALSYSDFRF